MARPTEYSDEVIELAEDYLQSYEQLGEVVPTIVGLCRHINRARSTVYEWASHDDKAEFSDIVARVSELQELDLVNGGLRGELNPQIAKTMMARHGYSDRQEIDHTTKGEAIGASSDAVLAALKAKHDTATNSR